MERRNTDHEKVRESKERQLLKQYLPEDDAPSFIPRVWDRSKQVAQKTKEVMGEVTEVVVNETVEWVDAGLDMLISLGNGQPKRKRNPYQ